MQDFFRYFFDKGTEPEFALFTPAHFIPILLLIAALVFIYRNQDKIRSSRFETNIRYVLGFSLIICDMSYYWRLSACPWLAEGVVENLPIGVCTWSVIFCAFMVIGKSQRLFDIAYFWLLSGSLFARLTPTPLTFYGPTRFRYYQFWSEHLLIYIAIFYMIFVHKMRPTIKSAIKSYIAFVVMAVVAYFANNIIGPGANYLFMAKPEDTPSILDILPSNFVIRVLIMASAVTFLYFVENLPWLI